jgi:GntR family transcriptional repressor for pyruvate dehydrogenase complex
MYETRRILEVGAAGLAAERATPDKIATLAEEVASLFATMHDPQAFLVHDISFHRAVAAAAATLIVASLVEMVSDLYYKRRRETAGQAADRDLRDAAEMHRRIFRAIRAREAAAARAAMDEHLRQASAYQAQEVGAAPVPPKPFRGPSGTQDEPREASGGRLRARGGRENATGARLVTEARRPRS